MRNLFHFIRKLASLFVALLVICVGIIFYSKFVIETKTAREAAPAETKFITIANGDQIAYQEIDNGSTETILFVGGLSGWSGTWKRTMTELDKNLAIENERNGTPHYNLVALDLPPFGFSTTRSTDFFRSAGAERINEFREALNLKNIIAVGHSYGAGVLSEAVLNDPNGVKRFVIIDGVLNVDEKREIKHGIFTDNPQATEAFMHLATHITPVIKNRLASFIFNKQNLDNDLTRIYMKSFSVKGNSAKFAEWIKDYLTDPLEYKSTDSTEYLKLVFPVRLIWGRQDTLTPINLADDLMPHLRNGRLYVLENVGHIPMIEDYENFDSALLKAITE